MTNTEHSIAQAQASIMVYDEPKKKWQPILPGNTLSVVNVTHHITSNIFKIVGRSLATNEVIITCNIVKNLKYNQATSTFHQWRDQKTIFGLNFPSTEDAGNFAHGINNALEILSRDVPPHITQQMPPPSQPPALPPRKNSSPHVTQLLEPKYINMDDVLIEKIREKDNSMCSNGSMMDGSSIENSIYDPVMIPTEHSRDMGGQSYFAQNGSSGNQNASNYGSPHSNASQSHGHRAGGYSRSHNLGIGQYPNDDADDRISIYSTSTNSSSSSGTGQQHTVEPLEQVSGLSNAAAANAFSHQQQQSPLTTTAGSHHRGSSGGSTGATEAAKYLHPSVTGVGIGGPIPPLPPQGVPQPAAPPPQPPQNSAVPIPPQPPSVVPPPPSAAFVAAHAIGATGTAAPPPAAPPNISQNFIPAPPPQPPPVVDLSPEDDFQSSFAAMLASVKLKKTKPPVEESGPAVAAAAPAAPKITPIAPPIVSNSVGGSSSAPKASAGGANFMSEMSALLAKRKQRVEGTDGTGTSSLSRSETARTNSESHSIPASVGSLNRRKSLTPAENAPLSVVSNPLVSKHSTSTTSLQNSLSAASTTGASTATTGSTTTTNLNQNTAALEAMKQEILTTVRAEIQAAKREIIDAIRAQHR